MLCKSIVQCCARSGIQTKATFSSTCGYRLPHIDWDILAVVRAVPFGNQPIWFKATLIVDRINTRRDEPLFRLEWAPILGN